MALATEYLVDYVEDELRFQVDVREWPRIRDQLKDVRLSAIRVVDRRDIEKRQNLDWFDRYFPAVLFEALLKPRDKLVLFVADGPWQRDDRLARKRRLLPRLCRDYNLSLGDAVEIDVTTAEGVRYAFCANIRSEDIVGSLGLLAREPSFICITERDMVAEQEVRALFSRAFPCGSNGLPTKYLALPNVLSAECSAGSVIIVVPRFLQPPAVDVVGLHDRITKVAKQLGASVLRPGLAS